MIATLTKALAMIFTASILLAPGPTKEEPVHITSIEPLPAVTLKKPLPAPNIYKAMLRDIGRAKGLPEGKIDEIEGVIGGNPEIPACRHGESTWDADAIGDGGHSIGLVQIHLPSHPEVTREQAKDPAFALNFIVDEFQNGNEWKWSCWRMMYRAPK